ncbi:pilus assembly protein CpaF [Caldimonas thermodepolymerans]|jgi:pilus assembly protein CpaF|uniref:Pilus assembly protein CpaF n=2 Tax=Caldimonas thermodepolymerans TaxID=215580 RepID=A0AA46DEA6_9BURK|nr:pilus assembly protein CpaF [Caldimonas thermodepolymerans]
MNNPQPMSTLDQPRNNVQVSAEYLTFKAWAHEKLVERTDELGHDFAVMSKPAVRRFVALEMDRLIQEIRIPLNEKEVEQLIDDLTNELTGFGPLEGPLRDPEVEDILVNGPYNIFIGKKGVIEPSDLVFIDEWHLMRIIYRLLLPTGRRVDESSPMVDARLPLYGRINVVIPPLALDGPTLSIRRFPADPLKAKDLIDHGTLTPEMLEFLQAAVQNRCNILISGGTSSGKTTLLNILASFARPQERIVTIEDTAELNLQARHIVRLETRPGGHDGAGAIDARDLLRNALRMRPDRIIVGEVRGSEAMEMLQAMTTGHDGSMGTLHANSPREALQRLELLLSFAGFPGQEVTLRRQIASALEIIVQVARLADGRRRVLSITEVTGMGDNIVALQEHFRYEPRTLPDGTLQDHWINNGLRPHTRKLHHYQPRSQGLQNWAHEEVSRG